MEAPQGGMGSQSESRPAPYSNSALAKSWASVSKMALGIGLMMLSESIELSVDWFRCDWGMSVGLDVAPLYLLGELTEMEVYDNRLVMDAGQPIWSRNLISKSCLIYSNCCRCHANISAKMEDPILSIHTGVCESKPAKMRHAGTNNAQLSIMEIMWK